MSNTDPAPGGIPEWTLGERLAKARRYAGVTAEQMADEIGRTTRTIRNYEADVTFAPKTVVQQYAMKTGVPLRWLASGLPPEPGDTRAVTIRYLRRNRPMVCRIVNAA